MKSSSRAKKLKRLPLSMLALSVSVIFGNRFLLINVSNKALSTLDQFVPNVQLVSWVSFHMFRACAVAFATFVAMLSYLLMNAIYLSIHQVIVVRLTYLYLIHVPLTI